ncbi:MAG: SGNH/GDSL hydrolase family protein [Armatimonadota bacterium]
MLEKTIALLQNQQPVNIVLYGDSISTVMPGEYYGGASCREMNWGQQLRDLLAAAYPDGEFFSHNFGIGGQNTYEGLGRLDWLGQYKPDLVLIAFGANDCGWHYLLPEETALALSHLIEWIRQRYGADVVVVGSGGENPQEACWQHLAETTTEQRRVAAEKGAPFVDTRVDILAVTDNGAKWEQYHTNRNDCHPNDAGHGVWAKAVFAVVKSEIEQGMAVAAK